MLWKKGVLCYENLRETPCIYFQKNERINHCEIKKTAGTERKLHNMTLNLGRCLNRFGCHLYKKARTNNLQLVSSDFLNIIGETTFFLISINSII